MSIKPFAVLAFNLSWSDGLSIFNAIVKMMKREGFTVARVMIDNKPTKHGHVFYVHTNPDSSGHFLKVFEKYDFREVKCLVADTVAVKKTNPTDPTQTVDITYSELGVVIISVEYKGYRHRVWAAENMEQYIKSAADSIEKLRKSDVYRVLIESNPKAIRAKLAAYIKDKRPDLADEVDDILEDEGT